MTTNQWPPITCLRILANAHYGLPRMAGCHGRNANRYAMQICLKMGWLGVGLSLTPLGLSTLQKETSK